MSEAGLRHLLSSPATQKYRFHFFRDREVFAEAMCKTDFFSVIYSLSGLREPRRECLMCLHMLSVSHPGIQRIVLAEDDREARLVSRLYPKELHGILSKSDTLNALLSQLVTLLGETRRVNDNVINHWYVSRSRMLSPTEHAILRHMSRGLSIPEIAITLDRNIKTVRAHKFNAMAKLGINSEVALLHAADIIAWLPISTFMQDSDSAVA
ncbi:DNA-binding transcriptional activator BglJ [Yokenella regensburgei]|uniref:DNA-binding transcriptional activator BglJ n=1 Tax=Yokenella regensburgei TaxID=158877 RepID=UPI003F190534